MLRDRTSATKEISPPQAPPAMLSHLAYYTPDVAATTEFYTKVLGLSLANVVMGDTVPSTGDNIPYFHIFLRMGDGSTIAFFEAPDVPPRLAAPHRAYDLFDHLALQVPNVEALDAWHCWLDFNGISVVGPVDHGIITSIYFNDPVNGFRLELTAHNEPDWNDHPLYAGDELKRWVEAKEAARKEGLNMAEALTDHVRQRAIPLPDRASGTAAR